MCKLSAQEPAQAEVMHAEASPETIESAVKAVANLGHAVVQGRYQIAIDRMNPKWKNRYAKQVGGIEKLEKKLKSVPAEMERQGVQMISFKPQGKPVAFGVSPESMKILINKKEEQRLVNTKWLVFVPTVTHFRITRRDDSGPAEVVDIESVGYQVAITDRGKNDWTFIDGAGLTVNDLRSAFIGLPQDMKLPVVEKRKKL